MNDSEQTSPNMTAPNQRTAPQRVWCSLKLGDCPNQHLLSASSQIAACSNAGFSRKPWATPGEQLEGGICLFVIK